MDVEMASATGQVPGEEMRTESNNRTATAERWRSAGKIHDEGSAKTENKHRADVCAA